MTTPHQSTDKITCSICGKENVPDWDGQGHCIKCARDLVLGDGHPSSAEEDLERAKHLLLAIDMAPDQKGRLEIMRYFFENHRVKMAARDRTKAQELLARLKAEGPVDKEHSGVSFSDFTQDLIDAEKKGFNHANQEWRTLLDNKAKELE